MIISRTFLFQIYLFARYNGRNERITLEDKMPSTSMRLDNNCANIDKKSFYLFNTFCFIGLPLFIFLLLSFFVNTIRPKLRSVLNPSLPKSSVNQNLAALVLTGLVFSVFVLICDILALVYSINRHELEILHEYEDAYIRDYTTATVIIIFAIDSIAFVISLSNIVFLFFLQTKQCNKKSLHHVLRIVCCICACKLIKDARREEYEPLQEEWSDESQELRQQAISLQRKEKWLLQKREEERQQKSVSSWLQQWENELERLADQLQQWENYLKQRKHCLPDERNSDNWRNELQTWRDELIIINEYVETMGSGLTDEQWQENLEIRQIQLKQKQNKLQNIEDEFQEKLNKRLFAESKAWLLLISLIAPLVCCGTHGGFVVMAWSSDPDEASSLAVVFTLSFFYYFIGFRQLYIRISSLSCFKLESITTSELFESIRDVSIELEEYHNNLREMNLPVLVCELFSVPFFMGIQALIVFSYYYLPGPISSVPLNVMNLLQLVLFVGTGLITYKLFTFNAPIEEIILDKFVKAYRPQASSSRDVAERVGETLGDALRKIVDSKGRPRARSMELSSLV